jgi:hypothetical protein
MSSGAKERADLTKEKISSPQFLYFPPLTLKWTGKVKGAL